MLMKLLKLGIEVVFIKFYQSTYYLMQR